MPVEFGWNTTFLWKNNVTASQQTHHEECMKIILPIDSDTINFAKWIVLDNFLSFLK